MAFEAYEKQITEYCPTCGQLISSWNNKEKQ